MSTETERPEPTAAERRAELVQMAYDVLHRSCPTTERADYIDPAVARAIAMGYLELALMPTALWSLADETDPWDDAPPPLPEDDDPANVPLPEPIECPDDDEGATS